MAPPRKKARMNNGTAHATAEGTDASPSSRRSRRRVIMDDDDDSDDDSNSDTMTTTERQDMDRNNKEKKNADEREKVGEDNDDDMTPDTAATPSTPRSRSRTRTRRRSSIRTPTPKDNNNNNNNDDDNSAPSDISTSTPTRAHTRTRNRTRTPQHKKGKRNITYDDDDEDDNNNEQEEFNPSDPEDDDFLPDEEEADDDDDDDDEDFIPEDEEGVPLSEIKSKIRKRKRTSSNKSGKSGKSKKTASKTRKTNTKANTKTKTQKPSTPSSSRSRTRTRATPNKKKVKKEESDDDFAASDTTTTKKKKKSKKVKKEENNNVNGSKTVKKEEEDEEEDDQFKWWQEGQDALEYDDGRKWTTLRHNGVMFPPEYEPHGVPIKYDGKEVQLGPEEEEVATMFAVLRDSEYYQHPTFRKNFFRDWRAILKKGENSFIKDLDKCDFTAIYEWYQAEKERKKNRSREEKKRDRERKAEEEEPYRWAWVDGRKEKVGNFKVEPPGLFRGRGEHPKMGTLKRRVYPEDVTINIGKGEPVPKPPEGHQWKEVVHNNKVTWLAFWKDPVKNDFKYVFLSPSSVFKGKSDFNKFETARRLKEKVDKIRRDYREDWKSEDTTAQQRAVALYLIDKLALRVGNEKDKDEADTVGCCTLRCEHVDLKKGNVLRLSFLGKDSIPYENEVEIEPKVWKLLQKFTKNKPDADPVFDKLTTASLNKYLRSLMEGLTAKVFRTYNASYLLDQELQKEVPEGLTVTEKVALYNEANREVAILCNHKKNVSKNHETQLEKIDRQIEEQKEKRAKLQKAKKDIAKRGYAEVKEKWNAEYQKKLEKWEKEVESIEDDAEKPKKPTRFPLPREDKINDKLQQIDKRVRDLRARKKTKKDLSDIALGTSKINYCDPRITVAWCRRNDVPLNKVYTKTLLEKFPWAVDGTKEDWRF